MRHRIQESLSLFNVGSNVLDKNLDQITIAAENRRGLQTDYITLDRMVPLQQTGTSQEILPVNLKIIEEELEQVKDQLNRVMLKEIERTRSSSITDLSISAARPKNTESIVQSLEHFESMVKGLLEDIAQSNIYVIEQKPENEGQLSSESPKLALKMNALVWCVQAIPFLPEEIIKETFAKFKAMECSQEPSLLFRYYKIKTGSTAILGAVNQLAKGLDLMTKAEPQAS